MQLAAAASQAWLAAPLPQALPQVRAPLPQNSALGVRPLLPHLTVTHLNHGLRCPAGDSAFQSLFSSSLNQVFQVSQVLQVNSGTRKPLQLGQETKPCHPSARGGLGSLLFSAGLPPAQTQPPRPAACRHSRPPGWACPPPARPLTLLLFSSSSLCLSWATASWGPSLQSPGQPPGSGIPCPHPNTFLPSLSPLTCEDRVRTKKTIRRVLREPAIQCGVQHELTLFRTLHAGLLLALHLPCPALPCQQGHRMGRDPVYLYAGFVQGS